MPDDQSGRTRSPPLGKVASFASTAVAQSEGPARTAMMTILGIIGGIVTNTHLSPRRRGPYRMVMPQAVEHWTRDMVLALPDDGMRHELIDGIHIVSPAPRFLHQRVVEVLGEHIRQYLKPRRLADVMILPGDLALGEDEVLQPDLFVYPLTSPSPKNWLDITSLLLVAEVLSPSTARSDRGAKRRRYQRARVPEYWVVDIDARLVERWRPDESRPEVIDSVLEWRVNPDADAFVLDLLALWREALGEE